jgi:two-component system chemotaxis sensor kinase CheA
MSDQAAMRATARAAVDGLLAAVAVPLERNDLGRLARMHSWGQNLVEAASPAGGPVVGAAVGQVAHSLVVLLERLILDEAAQPDRGTVLATEAVRVIERAYRGDSVETDALLQQINEAIGAGLPVASPPPATTPEPPATAMPARGAAASGAGYTSEPLVLDLSEREHLEGFLEEAAEHMDAIEAGLLDVEAEPENTTRINELFRPFHTIKGIAGFLNLRDINRLTHEIETILDLGRKNELRVTAATIDLIFAGVDVLKAQLGAIRQYLAGPTGGPCPQPEVATIIGKLRRAAQGDSPAPSPPTRPRLGEVLVAEGVATRSDVQTALDIQASEPLPRRRLGEILVDEGVTTPKTVDRALSRQGTESVVAEQSIRVDTRKLDLLVDAVGELVIAHSMVSLADVVRQDEKLHRNVAQVTKIVRDVQETAMAMRMVPIGQTFQKMRRVVRDVARKAGKPVELTLNGEETELDKNVIQQISDPLVHMVRNAIDHGIEPAAERRRAGKPEVGQITLNAFHQGDNIVIEIRDDGRGLDREKLIAKGIERGLVSPGAELTEQQAFALVLQSGFSTAEKVTDISGRGVGMDVVHRNVEQLRGQIDIQSEKGRGTVFRVRLPLTLAIIDGMLVRVGGARMIIPTILIEQSLRPERRHITTVQHRGAMLQVRGELCPLIPLRALFGYGEPADPGEDLVVIVRCAGQKIALVVDELIGQQQVVIKTLGARFKRVLGISGAAILGDGRVGLILEPTGLLALYGQQGSPACGPRPTSPDREPAAGPAVPGHGPERASSSLREQETSSKRAAASLAERVAAPL